MARDPVDGDGPLPADVMVIGERPGFEEDRRGIPFVGPAGQELFTRLWKVCRLTRRDVYTTNLVKTFSQDPPTAAEIAEWAYALRQEILQCRPRIIVTVGYHAARALLPQFATTRGDYFAGLAFPYTYGRVTPRTATLIPSCHSSAALRQPDKYQNLLTTCLQRVKAALAGDLRCHTAVPMRPYRVGLAGFGHEGLSLGLDTEGTVATPEAITLSATRAECCALELYDRERPQFLKPAVEKAKRLVIHNAPHDTQVLHALGILRVEDGVDGPRVDDTMLMAYHLNLPQSLKVLGYRELGLVMDEYKELVGAIDDARVRATLQTQLAGWDAGVAALQKKAARLAMKRTPYGKRVTKKLTADIFKRLHANSGIPANRVISGLRRMLTTTDPADLDAESDD